MEKGTVYVLKSLEGRLYIGSTDNLQRRLVQHRTGYTATTNKMGVFEVVLAQEYPSLQEARKIERKMKKLKRKDYVEKMIKDGYIGLKP